MVDFKGSVEGVPQAPDAAARVAVKPVHRPRPLEVAEPRPITTRLSREARQILADTGKAEQGDRFDADDFAERSRESLRAYLFQIYRNLGYSRSEATVKVERMTGAGGFALSRHARAALADVEQVVAQPTELSITLRIQAIEAAAVETSPPPSIDVFALFGQLEFADAAGRPLVAEPVILRADTEAADAPERADAGDSALGAWRRERSEEADRPDYEVLAAAFGEDRVVRTGDGRAYLAATDEKFPIARVVVGGAGDGEARSTGGPDPDLDLTT